MSNYREHLENYLRTLEIKADRVLDMGGASNPVKNRVKSWEVSQYIIADNGQETGSYDIKLDLNKPINEIIADSFDVVFCLEVFEYVWNPDQAMRNLSRALKEGGDIYVSFPLIYPVHNPKAYDYTRYTKDGFIRLLEENYLRPESIIPRKMTDEGKMFWKNFIVAEGMHASKGITHDELGYIIKANKV